MACDCCFQVVLASTPDLQSGYSRDLFVAWCGNSKNSIVLTAKTSPRTLARWLIDNQEAKTVTLEVSPCAQGMGLHWFAMGRLRTCL